MTKRSCMDCGRPLKTPTADRCLDCYRDWQSGPPLPLDDEPDWVVVERLAAGRDTPATVAERAAAARLLADRGYRPTAIARTLRMSGTRARQVIST